jgi:hypothetical protein
MSRVHFLPALIFILLSTQACAAFTNHPLSTEVRMEENTYIIKSSTQLTYKTLRIGAGNIWREDYTDAAGSTKQGLTAGLWIYVKDHDEQNQQVRVYPGEILTVGEYKITVLHVAEKTVEITIEP